MYGDEPNVAGEHVLASEFAQAITNAVVDEITARAEIGVTGDRWEFKGTV